MSFTEDLQVHLESKLIERMKSNAEVFGLSFQNYIERLMSMEQSLEDFRQANERLITEVIELRIRCNKGAMTKDVDGISLAGVHENASQDSRTLDATVPENLSQELKLSPILVPDSAQLPVRAVDGTKKMESALVAENL